MKISKGDFKVIFNKLINMSDDNIDLVAKNIYNSVSTGDKYIDTMVSMYSKESILNLINNIVENENATTEEESDNNIDLNLSELIGGESSDEDDILNTTSNEDQLKKIAKDLSIKANLLMQKEELLNKREQELRNKYNLLK